MGSLSGPGGGRSHSNSPRNTALWRLKNSRIPRPQHATAEQQTASSSPLKRPLLPPMSDWNSSLAATDVSSGDPICNAIETNPEHHGIWAKKTMLVTNAPAAAAVKMEGTTATSPVKFVLGSPLRVQNALSNASSSVMSSPVTAGVEKRLAALDPSNSMQVDTVGHDGGDFVQTNGNVSLNNDMDVSSEGNVRKLVVCARKRPMLAAERNKDVRRRNRFGHQKDERVGQDAISIRDNSIVAQVERTKLDGWTKYIDEHTFAFDHVFGEESDNHEVYQSIVSPIVRFSVEQGGKGTVFAYGQTGSGKTHTMFDLNSGICFLALEELISMAGVHDCVLSFFEIYQTQLFDLLADRRKVMACEGADGQVQIMNLVCTSISDFATGRSVIQSGFEARMTSRTGANNQSSRSHAILQMDFKVDGHQNKSSSGRICFVDLAGSERGAERSEVDRKTKLEGSEINKSLLALKECIRAMDKDAAHLPFRQSKLTMVLKDSIVGEHVRTAMIATVSPTFASADHTLNTLRYAERFLEVGGGVACSSVVTDVESMARKAVATSPLVSVSNSTVGASACGKMNNSSNNTPLVARSSAGEKELASPYTASPIRSGMQESQQRLMRKRQGVLDAIGKLQQQVKVCDDADVLEIMGEEVANLCQAFAGFISS